MPFSGGVAGTHTDSMHEGNAKRDTAGGLAGLEGDGDIIAPGANVVLTRNGSDEMELHERTSGEIFARWVREGLNDYTQWLRVGTAAVEVLHTAMKNVANGIAGLDVYMLPSVDIRQTRAMYELNSSLASSGNGTAIKDGVTRRYSVNSGISASSDGIIASTKTYTLGGTALMMVARVSNITNGAGSVRASYIGLRNSFSLLDRGSTAAFFCDDTNTWKTVTKHVTAEESYTVTVADGDILAIIATSSSVLFYVNGALVATHTTNLTTNPLRVGASVVCTSSVSSARAFDVDILDYGLEP